MFIDFNREVIDIEDLKKYIDENNINIPEYRVAVIALIIDDKGRILLQRRGPKSRDEFGKLEDIGGAYEECDLVFRDALVREISEEAGEDVRYNIESLIGGCLINKYNPRIDDNVNWLFLLYECKYDSGEFICNEDGKALGYEWYKYEDFPEDEVASSTFSFWKYYVNKKNTL